MDNERTHEAALQLICLFTSQRYDAVTAQSVPVRAFARARAAKPENITLEVSLGWAADPKFLKAPR